MNLVQNASHLGTGMGQTGLALGIATLVSLPILGIGGLQLRETRLSKEQLAASQRDFAEAHERLVAAAPQGAIDTQVAIKGRDAFMHTCAACHGADGRGGPGLGRDLAASDLVATFDDATFKKMIVTGRPTAQPLPMPPNAGRDSWSDEELSSVVSYVRGLQDPRRMPTLPAYVVSAGPVTEADQQAALAAAGGDAELAGYIASGNNLFHSTCVACHGKAGVGMPGNGKPLAGSAFLQSLDDEKLLAFVMKGRAPGEPLNTTGIQMPPKGGNPALSEDDLLDIIAYLRTLQPKAPARADGR